MQKLLIATTNKGKAKEYQELLHDLDLELVSLVDLDDVKDVKETGNTFEQNAILKAKEYFSQFNIPALSDDGGLEIDALGGEPGVKSHRWPGYEASDKELIQHALKKLEGIPPQERTAHLVSWAAFYDGKNLVVESEVVSGYITEQEPVSTQQGFPWRAILFISQFGKFYQDLTPEEHEKINHRRKIVRKLKPEIKQALKI